MSSIRNKLFLQVLTIIMFMVILLMIANTLLLEPYYIKTIEDQMVEAKVKLNVQDDMSELIITAAELGNKLNALISLFSSDGEEIFSSVKLTEQLKISDKLPENQIIISDSPMPLEIIKQRKIDSKTYLEMIVDRFTKQRQLLLRSELDNGYKLIINIPVAKIENSISIINRFLIVVGFVTLLFSFMLAFVMSRTFTRVILSINRVTKKMKKMDFDEKCAVESKDELGQLSESINELSEALDNALKELTVKNESLNSEIAYKKKVEEMRKQFVSNVSHELKTPISLIKGYAEGLEMNVANDSEKKEFYCSVIKEETTKMDKLVKNLLDLSKLESGNFDLYKSEFYINNLIEKMISKFENTLEENGIELEYQKLETLVCADAFRTEQILTNYINNAISHINGDKVIKIKQEALEKTVLIKVFNNGANIPHEELKKIWMNFYRINKARSRNEERYGIGLSIVKAICELDNKNYGVVNLPDGVEFYFELERVD